MSIPEEIVKISEEIGRINNNIGDAYSVCANKGALMPNTQNSSNLATCINSIPQGGEGPTPVLETLEVTPSTGTQSITPELGVTGFSRVDVSAVTSSIDENIQSQNIKSGVSILGVEGTVEELSGETKTVVPSTSQQVITPSAGKNGITQVNVEPVTSSIDENIQSQNIKSGVSILGVEGTAEVLNGEEITITPTTGEQIITPSAGKNGITKAVVEPFLSNYIWEGNSTNFSSITITPILNKFVYYEKHPSRVTLAAGYATLADDIFFTFEIVPETYTIALNSQAFRSNTARRIGFGVSLASATGMALMFYGCSNLEEIYGEPFDTSGITSVNNMPSFNLCPNLQKIVFRENTIKYSISFNTSPLLEDNSLISISNGLNESEVGQTLTLHATSKTRCSEIMGTVDSQTYTYKVFIPNESGTISLQEFITIEKGWTLA